MSGIVGSRLNIRGSGLVGSLGTDGQVFTSSGAGAGAIYEAAAGGGKVLQVVSTSLTGSTISTTSTSWAATSLTLDITPAATSSKIFLTATCGEIYVVSHASQATLYRDATNLGHATAGFASFYPPPGGSGDNKDPAFSLSYLDSPSSTSSVTYKVYIKTAGGTFYITSGATITITAMEIGA